jgi:hypothetical protein
LILGHAPPAVVEAVAPRRRRRWSWPRCSRPPIPRWRCCGSCPRGRRPP